MFKRATEEKIIRREAKTARFGYFFSSCFAFSIPLLNAFMLMRAGVVHSKNANSQIMFFLIYLILSAVLFVAPAVAFSYISNNDTENIRVGVLYALVVGLIAFFNTKVAIELGSEDLRSYSN